MPRLLFEKTGNAVWISHLDLMRLFQRTFKRAGFPLTHTHGYNPRPSVSIALPLSVGIESQCELLDFDLEHPIDSYEELKTQLNNFLIDGIRILDVIPEGKKTRELALLHTRITLMYDDPIPENAVSSLTELFARDSVIVEKKTKRDIQEQNIISMIHNSEISAVDESTIEINTLHCCQNPSLNPTLISTAIKKYLPQFAPDMCKYRRIEIYDCSKNIFR